MKTAIHCKTKADTIMEKNLEETIIRNIFE